METRFIERDYILRIRELNRENSQLNTQNELLKLRNKELIQTINKVKYNLRCSIDSINSKIEKNRNNYGTDRINDYRLVRLRAFRTKSKEILKMLEEFNL